MKIRQIETPHQRLLVAGLALILLAACGLGAMKAWAPGSDEAPAVVTRASARCAECGIVESVREIGLADDEPRSGHSGLADPPTRRYELTVRMKDGASRIFINERPANWHPGERVAFIAGAKALAD